MSQIKLIDNLYLLLKLFVALFVVIDAIKKRVKRNISKPELSFVLMFAYMIANLIVQNGFSLSAIETVGTTITLSLLIADEIDNHCEELMGSLSRVMILYMIANILTVFIFPKGLYTTYSLYENEYTCWLLGYKNPMSRFILVALGVDLCYGYLKHGTITRRQYILGAIGILTVIRVDSATSLVAIVMLYLFLIFFNRIRLPKFINLFNVFLAGGGMTALIILFRIQEYLSFLIVNILHRNVSLTSRIYIWNRALNLIKSKPIFGYGIQTAAASYKLLNASHPHNYYLYHLYTGGILGIIITSLMVFYTSRAIKDNLGNPLIRIIFYVLVAVLVMGITESLTQMPMLYPLFILALKLSDMQGEEDLAQ